MLHGTSNCNAVGYSADSIVRENKCKQLFAEREKFDYTRSDKHAVVAHEELHWCLRIQIRFRFWYVFVQRYWVFYSAYVRDYLLPRLSPPLRLTNCTNGDLSIAYAVTLLIIIVLFSSYFVIHDIALDRIMESKRRRKCDNKTKKSWKVMKLDETKILDTLRGGKWATVFSLTFRWYFNSKSKFPLIFLMINYPILFNIHKWITVYYFSFMSSRIAINLI